AHDLENDKNEFLALVTNDLRTPLTMILGLGSTLESHSDELQAERIRRMGSSIRGQAERISRLADDLYDMSRLESHSLLLSPRPGPGPWHRARPVPGARSGRGHGRPGLVRAGAERRGVVPAHPAGTRPRVTSVIRPDGTVRRAVRSRP